MRDTRLAILDTKDLTRIGLHSLALRHHLMPVGLYATTEQCKEEIQAARPTHLLMNDHILPAESLTTLIQWIDDRVPGVCYLVVTRTANIHYINQLLRANIHGILHENDPLDAVFAMAIDLVGRGMTYLSPLIVATRFRSRLPPSRLSDFSRIVLQGTINGWTVQQIANHYSVSDRTVYRARKSLRSKFGVRTTEELIEVALQWSGQRSGEL